MQLKNKVAFITGAASGIGLQIARAFAQNGAHVVVADLDEAQARATAARLTEVGEHRCVGFRVDVTVEHEVEAAFERTLQELGPVDVLVSNAGIQVVAPLVESRFDDWKRVLSVHLDGAYLTTRAAMRQMIQHDRAGSLIYIGSVHSKEASILKGPYVTAKHGLLGLAKVAAKEGAAHRIRTNVICPGFVRTPLVERQIPQQAAALHITEGQVVSDVMLRDTVDGLFTSADDIANLAVFLAAFESNALTGQSIVVSHGWAMQ
jgi:3-hydroxybutyrate dehydrogenase